MGERESEREPESGTARGTERERRGVRRTEAGNLWLMHAMANPPPAFDNDDEDETNGWGC